MDSFNPLSSSSSSFSSYTDSSPEPTPFSAMLDIYVHQARNIHNICIYANQDVYAKFSLTCSPDDTLCTQIIKGGGQNPDFNELLHLPIPHRDAVLKCEIWMLSRARNYLDDQLLGFTLVPLSLLPLSYPHPKLTQDFTLSSTDLFHSPAGTVQLSLSLDTCSQPSCNSVSFQDSGISTSTITSEVVLLNPDEYRRIEFPDIGVAKENQLMVSEYFGMAPSFLHLASPPPPPPPQSLDDYDMTKYGGGAAAAGAAATEESFQHSSATSLSDDRKSQEESNNGNEDDEHDKECGKQENEELASVFKSPLGNINFEEEQSVMQQQIVDMYMRSMQQFTESLAKMKLPMDLDNPKVGEDGADVIQSEDKSKLEALNKKKKKKDGSRVFYGSRAFF
ncbi:C2 domain-containing protein [Dioscorea alata]|uniref:C2 domain-containing protein n=1 Tax=Dioscorea alata TaxID=55571 RepID=A0ACB7V1E8_DIOAL|nr:C2 domain-containing protein [Dioscorea alata]